ncbi:hypothetical protein HDU98_004585 [Podochytrium sp. JEL0797]|nr:hypothetical protein HDU98_004585 [Podochytrium sp. JEL0797]
MGLTLPTFLVGFVFSAFTLGTIVSNRKKAVVMTLDVIVTALVGVCVVWSLFSSCRLFVSMWVPRNNPTMTVLVAAETNVTITALLGIQSSLAMERYFMCRNGNKVVARNCMIASFSFMMILCGVFIAIFATSENRLLVNCVIMGCSAFVSYIPVMVHFALRGANVIQAKTTADAWFIAIAFQFMAMDPLVIVGLIWYFMNPLEVGDDGFARAMDLKRKTLATTAGKPQEGSIRMSIDRVRSSADSSRQMPIHEKRKTGFFANFESMALRLMQHTPPPSPPSPVTQFPKTLIRENTNVQTGHLKRTVPRAESMLVVDNLTELTQLDLFRRLKIQWVEATSNGLDIDAEHRVGLSAFLAAMNGTAHLKISEPESLDAALKSSVHILSSSYDVHSDDPHAAQLGLIRLLTAGMSHNLHRAEIVRGAMILRVFFMSRGGSAVRLELIRVLIKFIDARVTPCVPLRGFLSAGGDSMSLAYIAALISGRFDDVEKAAKGPRGQFLTGKQALKLAGVASPIVLEDKEVLALVKGSSFSCAMAASCVLESHSIALLAQLLTAFSIEVLVGCVDAFDPAVAKPRSQPGQTELFENISHLLRESQLVGKDKSKLTLEIEINIGAEKKNGGTERPPSVADAMDRLRLQLCNAGRLIFAQHSEIINPALNHGLPTNLAWGPPSTDFGFKGLDMSMASYLSELGDLALPVQSAEHQPAASMALISARKTERAIELIQMLCSCLILSLCQAADLRALESAISERTRAAMVRSVDILNVVESDALVDSLMTVFGTKLIECRGLGWSERVGVAVKFVLDHLVETSQSGICGDAQMDAFGKMLRETVVKGVHLAQLDAGSGHGSKYLSSSSKRMYEHVRKTKNVHMYKDEAMSNIGRMLDQVLAFVQKREELDVVLLDCFAGMESGRVTASNSDDHEFLKVEIPSSVTHSPSAAKPSLLNAPAYTGSAPLTIPRSVSVDIDSLNADANSVAIVGIGLRYPEGIETTDAFWDMLVNAKDLITNIDPKVRQSFKNASPSIRGGWLSKEMVEEFDCTMFGLSPTEAKLMDPQHRIVLETVYSALEDANIPADSLRGTDTGVFMGCRPTGHDVRARDLYGDGAIPRHTATGADLALCANRVSFWLDVLGPSFSLTSACSTGGVLFDLAIRSVLQGQCKTALVGAMSIISHETTFSILEAAGIQTVDAGRCASYDKDADGYVPCESSVVFVIKRLDEAVKNGDRIVATICGVSNRHKGKEGLGITYPCREANTAAINQCLSEAKWKTDDVDFIEAHATGTKSGDPIESAAIAQSFVGRKRSSPLLIGAVKSILGHTENVAALTAIVKVALAMSANAIPPTLLDPKRLNPAVDKSFKTIPAIIPTSSVPWPQQQDQDKKALVLAAGLGGSVVALALKSPPSSALNVSPSAATRVLTISATSAGSLSALRDSYVALISNTREDEIARLAVSSNLARQHMRLRLAIPAGTKESLLATLKKWAPAKAAKKQPIVFVFPGQGSLDLQACAAMFKSVAPFRDAIKECTDALTKIGLPVSILEPVFSGATEVRGEYEQAILLILQYSIAKSLMQVGIRPSCVVGHSFGEIVAATIAGALTLEAALVLTHERHKPMLQPGCSGFMTSIFASLDVVQRAIAESGAEVDVAAHNGTGLFAISGSEPEVGKVEAALSTAGVQFRRLPNIVAFHSRRVTQAALSFQDSMKDQYTRGALEIPLASCLTSEISPINSTIPLIHWVDHITHPVLFAPTIITIDGEFKNAIYIDIGAGSMSSLVRRHLAFPGSDRQYLAALSMLPSLLASLYIRGVDIDWAKLHGNILSRSSMSALPLYAYSRVPVWDDKVGLFAPGKEVVHQIPRRFASTSAPKSKIVLVGVGLRMPGGVESLDDLWRAVNAESVAPGSLPSDRPLFLYEGSQKVKGNFLSDAFQMDCKRFGVSEEEAWLTSPRLRVQLETAWKAVESANIIPSEVSPFRCGVFTANSGGSNDLYSNHIMTSELLNDRQMTQPLGLFVPEEPFYIAEKLGFKGVCTSGTNGFCDSALGMLQTASDALQSHRIDVALCNTVNLYETGGHLRTSIPYRSMAGGALGEGAISVVLKRYEDAVRDGDEIHAILGEPLCMGSLELSDLRSTNLAQALDQAGLPPKALDLLLWGSHISKAEDAEAYAKMGFDSLQTSTAIMTFGKIFELQGLFGLAAVSLMMKHGRIPPSSPSLSRIMFSPKQQSLLNFEIGGVPSWSRRSDGTPRNAALMLPGRARAASSIILTEGGSDPVGSKQPTMYLLVVSADSIKSLAAMCTNYANAVLSAPNLAAFCQTSRLGRVGLDFKVAVYGRSASELSSRLKTVDFRQVQLSASIRSVVVVSETAVALDEIHGKCGLKEVHSLSSCDGIQSVAAILAALGLAEPIVTASAVQNSKDSLVVVAGSDSFFAGVVSAISSDGLAVNVSTMSSVEELFAAFYPCSSQTRFAGFDNITESIAHGSASLPSYVFDRHAVTMPFLEGRDLNALVQPKNVMPVTFTGMTDAIPPMIRSLVFGDNEWMLDHKLRNGKIILPGAALVNMSLEALTKSAVVTSLSFLRPAYIQQDMECEFVVVPAAFGNTFTISVGGSIHCSGAFSLLPTRVSPAFENIDTQLVGLLASGSALDPISWYETGESAIKYGPNFQNVVSLRVFDDETALARVELPADVSGTWIVHPAMLDACFHMMAVVSSDGSLPVRVEDIWVSDAVRSGEFPRSVWCYRQKVDIVGEATRRLRGNHLSIYDASTGVCVMVVGSLVVQLPGSESSATEEADSSLVWVNKWAAVEIPETKEAQTIWLLVGDNTDVIAALSSSNTFSRVIGGMENVADVIDSTPWAEWSEGGVSSLQIVFCGNMVSALNVSTGSEWWKHGGYPLFMRVWNEVNSRRVKTIESISAVIITPGLMTADGAVSRDSALTGLMLNIRVELRMSAKVLYLDSANLGASLQQAVSILKHPQNYESGSYTLSGSRLESQSYNPLRDAPRRQKRESTMSILITGGVGGLAMALAMHFLSQGHSVTLAGRRGVSDSSVESALKEASSDRVQYIQLDVSDAVAVSSALKSGRFDGIVHSAGVLENGLFSNVTDAALKKIGQPKVEGALAILYGLPDDKPCTVVFTSSVAAAIGSFGQTGYVLANTVMDGLALEYSNTRPNLCVRSAQLGLVDGVGMANDAADSHTSGEVTISKEDTVDILASILQNPLGFPPLIVAAPLGKFFKSLEVAPKLKVVTAASKDEIAAFISETMMLSMGFDEAPDGGARFSDLGVDSITSVSLQQSVVEKFGVIVPLLDLFQLTPDTLADQVFDLIMSAVENQEAAADQMVKNDIHTVTDMLAHHVSVRPLAPFIQLSASTQDFISFEKFNKLCDSATHVISKAFEGVAIDPANPPVVAILSGTSPEAMVTTAAVWKLGWMTAMLNPRTVLPLLIRQAQAVTISAVIVFDERDIPAATTVAGTLAAPMLNITSEILSANDGKPSAASLPVTRETPLCFLFSSSSVDGTSIKAARLTHYQVLESCKTRDLLWQAPTGEGRVLAWLPFSHVIGLIVDFINNGICSGMTLCLRPSREHPATPDFLLQDMQQVKPTLMYTVPWMLDCWVSRFQSNLDGIDALRGMKALIAGGAPLTPTTRQFLVANGVRVMEGMGATEAAGTILTAIPRSIESGPPRDEEGWMAPMPGFGVAIEPVPGWASEFGQLTVTGPSISRYVVSARSGESCVGLTPRNLLADGNVFRTGDIFERRVVSLGEGSEFEEFRFVSRSDDAVMLSTGFAVAPRMLEEYLVSHFEEVSAACLLSDLAGIPRLVLQFTSPPVPSAVDVLKKISTAIHKCAPELQLKEADLVLLGSEFAMPRSPKQTILRGLLRSKLFA